MHKTRFAALAALVAFTPTTFLYAEAPTEGAAPADAATPIEVDKPKAEKSKTDKPKAPPLAQLLKEADANGDQKLDLAEIQTKAPNYPQKRFTTLDTNQDGFLEAAEFPQKAQVGGDGATRGAMREKLKAADSDKNGKLSQAEYTAAFPNAPVERFAKLDRNSDGFVDRSDREDTEAAAGEKKKKGDSAKKDGKVPADTAAYVSDLVANHDADKDGILTKAELESAKPGFPEKTFSAMDKDNDGALSVADVASSTN